jgi:HTH-type transcriptional regulator, competence development regulator
MPLESEQAPSIALGHYLATLRAAKRMSLRDVEEATDREVSNAYLSQLENGKITKPSPHVLHALAGVYGTPYEVLMERAGYLKASPELHNKGRRHGRAATFAIDDLTPEEEQKLLEYLAFIRSQRGRR